MAKSKAKPVTYGGAAGKKKGGPSMWASPDTPTKTPKKGQP